MALRLCALLSIHLIALCCLSTTMFSVESLWGTAISAKMLYFFSVRMCSNKFNEASLVAQTTAECDLILSNVPKTSNNATLLLLFFFFFLQILHAL